MDATFDRAVKLVLDLEGGYADDPRDGGGQTRFGISHVAFPDLDIKSLTLESAVAVYRRSYWEAYKCGELPWPLALALFDSVVQFNAVRAVFWLQAAVGAYADGQMGPLTVAAANVCADPAGAVCQMMIARGEYRTTRPNYGHFGKGWRTRDLTVLCEAVRGF